MRLISSSFLFVWELSVRHPGVVLVLVGVFGEIALEWKSTKGKLAWLKKAFWIMLIFGLVLEFREAAKSDLEVAKLEKSNLELRAKLQDRVITIKQMEDFIFLTEKIPKIPIIVCTGQTTDERNMFAIQIRYMLDKAGFGVGTESLGADVDYHSAKGVRVIRNLLGYPKGVGKVNQTDTMLYFHSTNEFPPAITGRLEQTNGFGRSVLIYTNKLEIYCALGLVFNEIGISCRGDEFPSLVESSNCCILVGEKSH